MKQLLVISVVLALARTMLCDSHLHPRFKIQSNTRNLGDDFKEFKEMISFEKITNLVFDYFNEDFEFQELVEYLLTDRTKEMILEVENIAEVKAAIVYLHDHGVDIYQKLNDFHHVLEMEDYSPVLKRKIVGGLAGFVQELKNIIPYDDLKNLYDEKMRTSQDFRDAVEFFSHSTALVEAKKNEKVQEFVVFLRERHVELREITELLHQILGIPISFRKAMNPLHRILGIAKTLGDDFKDFQNLVNFKNIEDITLEYLNNDGEFQEFVEYVLSENTKEMVTEVESISEVRQVFSYLHENSVEIYKTLNEIHELLDMEAYKPFLKRKITGGLAGYVKDVRAVIPFEEIKALYEDKLLTSQAFRDAVAFFKSEVARTAFEKVKANSRVQAVVEYLRERGVNVHEVLDLFHQLTGIPVYFKSKENSFGEHLKELQAFVPFDKVKKILYQYFQHDSELNSFVNYISSENNKEMLREIESIAEVREMFRFLNERGLDVYAAVNSLHNYLNMEPYQPFSMSKISGGLRGLISDVEAVIPFDQMKALYQHKLETSQNFREGIEFFSSETVKTAHRKIFVNKRFAQFLQYLNSINVNIKDLIDVAHHLSGVPILRSGVKHNLGDDFHDFEALLPSSDIYDLINFSYFYIKEVRAFLGYIHSDSMNDAFKEIARMQEVQNFLTYLSEHGGYVGNSLNIIREKYHRYQPFKTSKIRRSCESGLADFFEELEYLIPFDQLYSLYYEKLQSSQDFQDFVRYTNSAEVQSMVYKVLAHPQVREIGAYLEERNVDAHQIQDVFNLVFNIHVNVVKNLGEDFDEFLALIPSNDMLRVTLRYLQNDEDVAAFADYLASDEVRSMVIEIERIKSFHHFVRYLEDEGVLVQQAIDLVHEFLGIERSQPFIKTYLTRETGLLGYFGEIEALIPFDDLKALAESKMIVSPSYRKFVVFMKSVEVQNMYSDVLANAKVNNFIAYLQQNHVNPNRVAKVLGRIFGIDV